MKKTHLIITSLFVALMGVTTVQAEVENGIETGNIEASEALSVWIENDAGNKVTTIRLSNPWIPNTNAYWIRWSTGGASIGSATVKATLKNLGPNPLKRIIKKYNFGASGYNGSGSTPLAVSDWGGTSVPGKGKAIFITPVGKVATTFKIIR